MPWSDSIRDAANAGAKMARKSAEDVRKRAGPAASIAVNASAKAAGKAIEACNKDPATVAAVGAMILGGTVPALAAVPLKIGGDGPFPSLAQLLPVCDTMLI